VWNVPVDGVLSTTVAGGWAGGYMFTSWRPVGTLDHSPGQLKTRKWKMRYLQKCRGQKCMN